MDNQFVKVSRELLDNLIYAASNARSLLDDVHCYDTDVYEELGEALEDITYEVISDE